MFVEHKYKELQEPDSFGLVDHAKVETEFYELLNKIEKQIGSKACPEGESNLWKELQFLLKNDPVNSSKHWMSFHQISEFRDSIYSPETRSTEQIIAEYESKLLVLLQTWQDYTGSAYPH